MQEKTPKEVNPVLYLALDTTSNCLIICAVNSVHQVKETERNADLCTDSNSDEPVGNV